MTTAADYRPIPLTVARPVADHYPGGPNGFNGQNGRIYPYPAAEANRLESLLAELFGEGRCRRLLLGALDMGWSLEGTERLAAVAYRFCTHPEVDPLARLAMTGDYTAASGLADRLDELGFAGDAERVREAIEKRPAKGN